MALIATPGTADANSYLTVAEADAYFAERLYSEAWGAASNENKEAALIMATGLLDSSYVWSGSATTPDQTLAWPRTGMKLYGQTIASDVIPRLVKKATAEIALYLLGNNPLAVGDTDNISKVKAGPVEVQFKDSAKITVLPSNILSFIPIGWVIVDDPDDTSFEAIFKVL